MWNAVTGRTSRARACLAALRAQERRIRRARIDAIQYFELQQERHERALKSCAKQRENYLRWFETKGRKLTDIYSSDVRESRPESA